MVTARRDCKTSLPRIESEASFDTALREGGKGKSDFEGRGLDRFRESRFSYLGESGSSAEGVDAGRSEGDVENSSVSNGLPSNPKGKFR